MSKLEQTLCFVITSQCNLRCNYCFENSSDRTKVLTDTQILEFINEAKQLELNITQLNFYGGEPSLYPELIEFAIDTFFNVFNFYPKIMIFTNGTQFKNERVKDLYTKYDNIKTQISIDGIEEAHNINRKQWKETVEGINILKSIIKKEKNQQLIINSVVDKNCYKYLKDSYLFLSTIVDTIPKFRFLFYDLNNEEKKELKNQMLSIKDLIINKNYKINFIRTDKFIKCGIGNIITLSPIGIFPCQKFYGEEKFFTKSLVFSSIKEYLESNAFKYLVKYTTDLSFHDKCKNCKAKIYCFDQCPMQYLFEKGDIKNDLKCDIPKIIYEVFGDKI